MIDLDEILARAKAATDGPWAWEATGDKDNTWGVGQVLDDATDQPVRGENPRGENTLVEPVCTGDDNLADAVFIAHAREDVPALAAELRAAQLERDQLSRDASDARRQLGIAAATVVRLDAELRGFRDANTALMAKLTAARADTVQRERERDDAHAEINQLDIELRAAREVVDAARFADADAPEPWRAHSDAADELRRALAAYDQAAAR